jgi:hypothetical protein
MAVTDLISKTDKSLAVFRKHWLASTTERAAAGWLALIDDLLDLRSGLMRLRDETSKSVLTC